MAVTIRNTAATEPPPAAPTDDGRPYRFEMIYAGGTYRGYADDPAELIGMLVPGYAELGTDAERAEARVRLAMDLQVRLQAQLAVGGEPVPAVLVSAFYEPAGPSPRPPGPAELQIWLDPADDWTLLTSLHTAGLITVSAHA
jgi:hypothetical protein